VRGAERKRAQQNAIEHAEYGGVRANPERESQDDNPAEKRLLQQNAQRMTVIAHEIIPRATR
jgi:hypothetical protein